MAFLDETGATILADEVKTYVGNTAVAKETGKGLSTNDYTTTEKNKLAGIADGANKTIVDSALDTSSENPVQNKVVKEQIDALTTQINNAIALRSSLEQYGMAKLSNSAAVTDSTGLALPATEKNATIDGTLANQIAQLNTNYENIFTPLNELENADDATFGLCRISYGFPGNPYNFWCTIITFGVGSYKQQIAIPWACGELEKSIKYRIFDLNQWTDWHTL